MVCRGLGRLEVTLINEDKKFPSLFDEGFGKWIVFVVIANIVLAAFMIAAVAFAIKWVIS